MMLLLIGIYHQLDVGNIFFAHKSKTREPPLLTCFAGKKGKIGKRLCPLLLAGKLTNFQGFQGELDLNSSFAQVHRIFAWENWYQESQRRMAPGWAQRKLLFPCKSAD